MEVLQDRNITASRLGISSRTLIRHENVLIAKGLVKVRAGSRVLYQASSVDTLIKRAVDRGESLFGGAL